MTWWRGMLRSRVCGEKRVRVCGWEWCAREVGKLKSLGTVCALVYNIVVKHIFHLKKQVIIFNQMQTLKTPACMDRPQDPCPPSTYFGRHDIGALRSFGLSPPSVYFGRHCIVRKSPRPSPLLLHSDPPTLPQLAIEKSLSLPLLGEKGTTSNLHSSCWESTTVMLHLMALAAAFGSMKNLLQGG